jgi:hypothetical protein
MRVARGARRGARLQVLVHIGGGGNHASRRGCGQLDLLDDDLERVGLLDLLRVAIVLKELKPDRGHEQRGERGDCGQHPEDDPRVGRRRPEGDERHGDRRQDLLRVPPFFRLLHHGPRSVGSNALGARWQMPAPRAGMTDSTTRGSAALSRGQPAETLERRPPASGS